MSVDRQLNLKMCPFISEGVESPHTKKEQRDAIKN